MRHGIHSYGKILTEDSQGLLSHRTLIRITRTLIMIWEGNDRGGHSEYLFDDRFSFLVNDEREIDEREIDEREIDEREIDEREN